MKIKHLNLVVPNHVTKFIFTLHLRLCCFWEWHIIISGVVYISCPFGLSTQLNYLFILEYYSEREDAKRRERAWASINETAKRNPLYSLVVNGGDANGSSSPLIAMDTTASGPSPINNGESEVGPQRNGLEGVSPAMDNDEDVGASLRSLQRESEEEVSYLNTIQ